MIKNGYYWYYSWARRGWMRGKSVAEMEIRQAALTDIEAAETLEEKQQILAEAKKQIRKRKGITR